MAIFARALYDYSASSEEDIQFSENDIILILSDDGDWCRGRLVYTQTGSVGAEGLVPANYLEHINPSKSIAEYDYDAENESELSIAAGQPLNVYNDVDGWSFVHDCDSDKYGFVPTNYLISSDDNQHSKEEQSSSNFAGTSFDDDNQLDISYSLQTFPPGEDSREFDDDMEDQNFSNSTANETKEHDSHLTEKIIPKMAAIDITSNLFPVAAIVKVGKKTKNRVGFLCYSQGIVKFLGEKDKEIIQEWNSEEITQVKREKKLVHLEMQSLSYDFQFKSKNDAIEFIDCVMKTRTSASNRSLESNDSTKSNDSLGKKKSKFGSTSSIPAISSPLAGSFVHLEHNEGKPPSNTLSVPEQPSIISSIGRSAKSHENLNYEHQTVNKNIKSSTLQKAQVLYKYESQGEDELSVDAEEIVSIEDSSNSDWFMVSLVSDPSFAGYVPASYLHVIDEATTITSIDQTENIAPPKPPRPDSASKNPSPAYVSPIKPPRPGQNTKSESPLTSPVHSVSSTLSTKVSEVIPKEQFPILQNAPALPTRPAHVNNLDQDQTSQFIPIIPFFSKANQNQPSDINRGSTAENVHEEISPKNSSGNHEPSAKPSDLKSSSSILPRGGISKPDIQKKKIFRTWSDKTGTFKVEAEFIGIVDGKILLHKSNGVKIGVPAEKLSKEDLMYVTSVSGQNFEENISSSNNTYVGGKQPTIEKTVMYNNFNWKEYLKSCGIDSDDAEKYAFKLAAEKMDKDALLFIDRNILKSFDVAEGDIIRILKRIETETTEKKQSSQKRSESKKEESSIFSNSAASLFSDPEVQARIMQAERNAQMKNTAILASMRPNESLATNSTQESVNLDQVKKDEELARKLQEDELRRAGLMKESSSKTISISAISSNSPKPASKKDLDSFVWPEVFSSPVKVESSQVSSSSNTGTIRRGRVVQGGNTVDPNTIFNAAKIVSSTPSSSVNDDNNTARAMDALFQQSMAKSDLINPPKPSSLPAPLIPISSSASMLPVTVSSGNEQPKVSVAQNNFTRASINPSSVGISSSVYNNLPVNKTQGIMVPQSSSIPSTAIQNTNSFQMPIASGYGHNPSQLRPHVQQAAFVTVPSTMGMSNSGSGVNTGMPPTSNSVQVGMNQNGHFNQPIIPNQTNNSNFIPNGQQMTPQHHQLMYSPQIQHGYSSEVMMNSHDKYAAFRQDDLSGQSVFNSVNPSASQGPNQNIQPNQGLYGPSTFGSNAWMNK